MLTTSVFISAIFATSCAQAGHLFTQASSNHADLDTVGARNLY